MLRDGRGSADPAPEEVAMSTTMDRTTGLTRPEVPTDGSRGIRLRVLLVCGVVYSVVYAVANDVIAATLYDGYSRMSQAISELSATGAPTRPFLTAMVPVFSVLMIAFGIGVWKAATRNRALRVTGALFIAHGLATSLWLLAPMSSREEMIEGTMPANDVGHIVLTAVTVLLILGQIGFGAAGFGMRFRLYSIATAVTVLVFGALTGMESPKVPAGDPTPWMGLYERISVGAWLLWMAVLAIILLHARRAAPEVRVPDTPGELVKRM
jgi:hypothetical protein